MRKILIFGAIILVLFGSLAFATTYQNKQAAEGNIYGKNNLHPATIEQLDDPDYQNIILPNELEKKLENGKDAYVYFYSPTCTYCKATTPILMPVADEVGVEINQLNLLEYEDAWNQYRIEATPTLIQFKDGKEVARIEGANTEDFFRELLIEWKENKN